MKSNFKLVLANAVLAMLKPLVRVLIRNELSHSEFSELARQAYVEMAYERFSIPGRKTTYSRVAVLTGLSRKEVVRLYKKMEQREPAIKTAPNRAVRVTTGWLQDSEFLADNKPADLPLQGEYGSFASLVARYSGDITLGAIVDELERNGVVSRPDKQTVRLNSYGYIPREDELEKIKIMSVCTADLLHTTAHNLEHEEQDARFQRQIIYPGVPESVAREFKAYSSSKSAELLQHLNHYLSSKIQDHKSGGNDGTDSARRVGLGIYYIENFYQKETEK